MPQRQSNRVQSLALASDGSLFVQDHQGGALLSDTKTLLSQWDTSSPVQANLARIRQENIFGKASRSRVEDILAIFRQRYLVEDGVIRALVALVRDRLPANALDRILYFHAASADLLLHDIVTEWLAPRLSEGRTDLDTSDIQRLLVEWVAQGKTKGEWSEETTSRVAQGLLSTLRDFGVLQGAVTQADRPRLFTRDRLRIRAVLPEAAPTLRCEARRPPRLASLLPHP